MDKTRVVVEDVLTSLEMRPAVRHVYAEETDSPWNEKILVKRKKDHADVKIVVWNDNLYLYGRIYRLLLYIRDMLDASFEYDSAGAPGEDEPEVRELYSQIWGVYVDSRLERARIPNFYDRLLRRNMFTEALKGFDWRQSRALFDALWSTESMTHGRILQYARDPCLVTAIEPLDEDAVEIRIGASLKEHSVKKHLQRLTAGTVRHMADEILNFTLYHCRDASITSRYFGIRFTYKNTIFAEMVVDGQATLLVTLHNPRSHASSTMAVTEESDLAAVQQSIKEVFSLHFLDLQSV